MIQSDAYFIRAYLITQVNKIIESYKLRAYEMEFIITDVLDQIRKQSLLELNAELAKLKEDQTNQEQNVDDVVVEDIEV